MKFHHLPTRMMLHAIVHHPLFEKLRSSESAGVGLLILRGIVGTIFIYHGGVKLLGLDETIMFFFKVGIPSATFLGPLIAGLEFIGGALLMLGLASRLLAAAFTFDMAVAIVAGWTSHPLWADHEFELLLLAASLLIFLAGPGILSIDHWLLKVARKAHKDALPMRKV